MLLSSFFECVHARAERRERGREGGKEGRNGEKERHSELAFTWPPRPSSVYLLHLRSEWKSLQGRIH